MYAWSLREERIAGGNVFKIRLFIRKERKKACSCRIISELETEQPKSERIVQANVKMYDEYHLRKRSGIQPV